jgi:acyl-coenzyme A thioesterase 13
VRFMSEASAPPIPGYLIYDPVDPFENRAGPFFWAGLPDGTHSFAITAAGRHCNSQGLVHGGLLMTMIDLALVITAKSAPDEQLVTVSLNSGFMSSAREGDLIEARGELLRRTRSLAFVRGRISRGDRMLVAASAVLKPMNAH